MVSARAGLAVPHRLFARLVFTLVAVVAVAGAAIAPLSAAHAAEAPKSFADLAARLLPAVVNVSTTQTIRNPERAPEMPHFPPGSPFQQFFKDFMEHQRQRQALPEHATSLGSGFIIDPAGYIVTNNHVIQDADAITVTLHDNAVFKAKVVGRDIKTDLALLKIDPGKHHLVAVKFGDSTKARVGDWVLAIGNPYGLGGTVTAGIVSARARDINAGPYDDFIQTDAAINRGNSGGPMFNMNGNVIGINTAIFSPSGGSIGIGFAIPSSIAEPVIAELKKDGKVVRGWLGVRIQSIDEDLAKSMGLPSEKGALVASVMAGSPAGDAGVKPGDVILEFDGKPIPEMRSLPLIVAETPVGKTVEMKVWRSGHIKTLSVKVGELKSPAPGSGAKSERPHEENGGLTIPGAGMAVAAMSDSLRRQYHIPQDTKGLVVIAVDDGGAASEKGIKPGDVIIDAGQNAVESPDDLAQLAEKVRSSDRRTLLLRVENDDVIRYVVIDLSKR
jgi:serine protease Do